MTCPIAERLKRARKNAHLTQRAVESHTGIGSKSISRYECGSSAPEPDTIVTLLRLYDVSAAYILGLSDRPGRFDQDAAAASAASGSLSATEQRLLAAYRGAAPERRAQAEQALGLPVEVAPAPRTILVAAQGGGVSSHVITASDEQIRQAMDEDESNFDDY